MGANICAFSRQYNCDHEFSVVTVRLGTLLPIVTVPLPAALARMVL